MSGCKKKPCSQLTPKELAEAENRTCPKLKKAYNLKVRLQSTGELFWVKDSSDVMTITEMKSKLELVAGVPRKLQRLTYLDEGDLPDNTTLEYNDVVRRGTIIMKTWGQDGWDKILTAAAKGAVSQLSEMGVTKDSTFNTPNSRRMNAAQREEWIAERASASLFIAAHRGHHSMVKFLLENGANTVTKTEIGNTALHVAALMGKSECIDQLLSFGALMSTPNNEGVTPQNYAQKRGNQASTRKFLLHQWKLRSASIHLRQHLDYSDLFPHQKFDSSLKTWRKGTHAKLYMLNLSKPSQFLGSAIGAPRRHGTGQITFSLTSRRDGSRHPGPGHVGPRDGKGTSMSIAQETRHHNSPRGSSNTSYEEVKSSENSSRHTDGASKTPSLGSSTAETNTKEPTMKNKHLEHSHTGKRKK
eukprot:gi/632939627/ref/XP_007910785.1/ PREDICTED: ankyrin repeat domain-containing protein 60 [Callorhinchus milii]